MFTLIELPYAEDALEPVISARTIGFHHGKHLQGYVDNLNKLIAGTGFEGMDLEEIVKASAPLPPPRGTGLPSPVFNNAGQILNHNLYFTQFRPAAGAVSLSKGKKGLPLPEARAKALSAGRIPGPGPESLLAKQIVNQWGSLDAFKDDFVAKGAGLFGSGWVWLAAAPDGSLAITQEPGASNPVVRGLRPILTFDVWEHAYYLDYQNRRPAHLAELWKIVDWEVLEQRYRG
jgi:Fe-Mn family superoxide dismutase